MRRVAAALLAVSIGLLLAGCGGAPDHGYVHDKSFTPAHTLTTVSCATIGKSTVCNPVTTFIPDDYELDIYENLDGHGDVDPKGPHDWQEVTAETFAAYKVGSYIDFRKK